MDPRESASNVCAWPKAVARARVAAALLPLRRIQEEIWFGSKRLSPLLWIADSCAFSLRRQFAKLEGATRFCEAFAGQIPLTCRQILPVELAGLLPR
jgi:hypothetical protein